ncbi:MAG: MMPL family transporter [Deltaproteobacteria bacterium]|nr:MMPL family transporter [Deltaproteobacteria bacterium]
MLARLGGFIYRHPRPTLAVAALLFLISLDGLFHGGKLVAGKIAGLEADVAERWAAQAGWAPDNTIVVVFSSADLGAIDAALAPLHHDPAVRWVVAPSPATPFGPRMVDREHGTAYALIALAGSFEEARAAYPRVRAAVTAGDMTGRIPLLEGVDRTLERDLIRAELISLPLALLVLLLVFRSAVAAVLPVAVGGLAVLSSIAIILALARVTEVASYTINVASLIGLGVAIDYSLFTISRYREELAAGRGYRDALVRAMATSGRVVVFSGLAVGTGLAGLVFFRGSYLASMGLGGAIVVALAVLFALTVLPALLALLGPNIDRGRVPIPRRLRRRSVVRPLATAVAAHPWRVLLPTLGFLLLLGVPFLFLRLGGIDARVLGTDAEARRGYELLRRDFPELARTDILVAVAFPGPVDARRTAAVDELARRLGALPGVTNTERLGGERVVLLHVFTADPPEGDAARALVRQIRAHRHVADGELAVGGQTASDIDGTDFIVARVPYAIAFVVGATLVVLFWSFGSVVVPVKAVLMNVVSIAGSFGALVWAFQEGHLFGAEARPIDPSVPILLFCILFGLSMDYEVLLLSRIREAYALHGDNTRAVVDGLDHSAALVTSAAAIMVTVFGAFAFARFIVIKEVGFGMALGVALDATLVRLLLVPSTMVLLGRWNWWAPRRWRRFAHAGGP